VPTTCGNLSTSDPAAVNTTQLDSPPVSPVEQVADGVYRLGTEWVGWYLCEVDGSLTVVDCGFPAYFEQLPAALSELGHPLDAVTAVVLTHYHSDHVGSAERIRNVTGATVFAPAADAPGIGSGRVPVPGGMAAALWRPAMIRYMAHAIRNGGAKFTPVKELRPYGDGDVLDAPGALRAIHTPGHTGGHCSLLSQRTGVLFAGDALATHDFFGGPSGPQLVRFNEDGDRAMESLSRLEALPATVVVVGHGRPFQGAPAEAVERVRAGP
jgi:glyoxylase-like metal-dependent hydrolase (beta-lactamase superfamily II)